MTEVLVLNTYWEPDYWERDKVAPYPQRSIEPLRHLKDKTPIAAIGVYTKGKGRDYTYRPPCFLIVKNISENESGEPRFDFHFISPMQGITSAHLSSEIPRGGLFFALSEQQILTVLKKLGTTPPSEWLQQLGEKNILPSPWLDWVGKHYQEIQLILSNSDYEDRIAEIFTAVGFEVEQLGHKQEGEYADGIAYSKNFAIIYDCKNRRDYFLNAEDKRAIIRYVQHEKKRIAERKNIDKVYFAIIAHSYGKVENVNAIERETSSKGFLLTSEAMQYLLYRKISLGPKFLLADFEDLITNKAIDIESIKNVYKG
jgi:hypothetical protein